MAQTIALPDRTAVDPDSVRALRRRWRGSVIEPGDAAYEPSRTAWNIAGDRRPALLARAADADDVRQGIRFAREEGLPLAIRSGGHSIAGHSTVEGGLVLDLRDMTGIRIDAERRTV